MLIIDDLNQFPKDLRYPVMAIGVFDGVHRGHQMILRCLIQRSQEKQGTPVVLTFAPHPQKIISPAEAPLLLQTKEQKERILKDYGVNILARIPFTRRLSLYTPEEFARKILHNHSIREIYVGSNFRFGHRRSGDIHTLRTLGEKFDFAVHEIQPVYFRTIRISSTRIRRLLQVGRVALAKRLLGRPYQIVGIVVRGSGRGVHLGFPTANLEVESELIPATGVYATRTVLDEKTIPSVTNVGYRPTLDGAAKQPRPIVETHMLDFEDNIYGQPIQLEFCFRLRAEKKFDNVEELKEQIGYDVRRTRRYRARLEQISV